VWVKKKKEKGKIKRLRGMGTEGVRPGGKRWRGMRIEGGRLGDTQKGEKEIERERIKGGEGDREEI
jgi:hypothetical protein